jgi:hypothetical protein
MTTRGARLNTFTWILIHSAYSSYKETNAKLSYLDFPIVTVYTHTQIYIYIYINESK